jgi:hypothetical protein
MSFDNTLFPPEHTKPANALQPEAAEIVDLSLGRSS